MSSNAISGVGTVFSRWSGSAWTALAEVKDIKGPGMKRETIEVTNLSSLGGYKEFIAGFRDAGTVSLTMNFTYATYCLLLADFESNLEGYYAITLPDVGSTTFEFGGLVTELPLNVSAKDAVTADCTITISGQVEVFEGAPSGAPSSNV